MEDYRPHRKLVVWNKAMAFVKEIYLVTSVFPKHEEYGLCSQLRRAAVSVPSNLAEGAARKGAKEFKQFLNIAQGSISEIDTKIELAFMLGYLNDQRHSALSVQLGDISKMLFGLTRSIQDKA